MISAGKPSSQCRKVISPLKIISLLWVVTTTTSEAELDNVPIDAVAFAETALVYSALLNKAPSNAEVALPLRSLSGASRLNYGDA